MSSIIRERREALNLSQEDLALKAGIKFQRLGRLERGQLPMQLRDVRKLAPVLGCKPSDLMPEYADLLRDELVTPAAQEA